MRILAIARDQSHPNRGDAQASLLLGLLIGIVALVYQTDSSWLVDILSFLMVRWAATRTIWRICCWVRIRI